MAAATSEQRTCSLAPRSDIVIRLILYLESMPDSRRALIASFFPKPSTGIFHRKDEKCRECSVHPCYILRARGGVHHVYSNISSILRASPCDYSMSNQDLKPDCPAPVTSCCIYTTCPAIDGSSRGNCIISCCNFVE